MQRNILLVTVCCLLLQVFSVQAQSTELKFNKEGKFRIVQFTDVHMKHGDPASDIALERIREVLDAERPDLVVFTGDIIYGKPADKGMQQVLQQAADRKIPFAVFFGNHDDEQDMSREELMKLIRTMPYNINPALNKRTGYFDALFTIGASAGKQTAAVIYGFDSHSYSRLEGIGGYDWLKNSQINWYMDNSAALTRKNGGKTLPALAFFHIPLPEYTEAVKSKSKVTGTRMEGECAPEINSGMFTAMRTMGDMMGMFVGHDHDNDYVTVWKGIALAYGRYTGGNTVYNHLPNGARVIEMKEGERMFDTWIRLKDGKIENKVTYPADFTKAKE